MILIAVDPGITGALAFFSREGTRVSVHDMPVRKCTQVGKIKNEIDPIALQEMIREMVPPDEKAVVVMEALNTFAGGSVQSMASLEASKAVIRTVMELSRFEVKLVSPKIWQKSLGIKSTATESTKAQSLRIARGVYGPHLCPLNKDHGRADALLIGSYAMKEII